MSWGVPRRPKISTKLGSPHPREGSDGDIQIKGSALGAKLWGKWSGIWRDVPLSKDGVTKFGVTDSNYLSIDRDSVDIISNKVKVASFGSTTTVKDINLTGKISVTSTGSQNVMMGVWASTDPDVSGVVDNIVLGVEAGKSLASGATNNVFIGTNAGENLIASDHNTAIGYNALSGGGDITGSYNRHNNVVIGRDAVTHVDFNGGQNVVIGASCGNSLAEGAHSNICIGFTCGNAGGSRTNDACICIGFGADNSTTGNEQLALGANADTTGANQIRLGSSNISQANIQVDWTIDSDERIKDNIQSSSLGLEFIKTLRTVTFTKKHPADWDEAILEKRYKKGGTSYNDDTDEIIRNEFDDTTVCNGLIAQEVKSSMDNLGVGFSAWTENVIGRQGLQYSTFVMPLIKAVQELSAKIDTMQVEINNLKA